MRKAQFNAIQKCGQDKTVKIIDENFEKPPEIIIYAQKERGSSILEYIVTATGTVEYDHVSYSCNKTQQEFFDRELTLKEFLQTEEISE